MTTKNNGNGNRKSKDKTTATATAIDMVASPFGLRSSLRQSGIRVGAG
jgi:hypothetical protein